MQYETEEQQVEALKEWWRENGRAVILGVVIGIGLIGGWSWWQSHQLQQSVAASDTFSLAMEATNAGNFDEVIKLADNITDDHSESLYAAYTNLLAARAGIENGDLDAAAKRLNWVVKNASLEDVALIAKVRLARVKAAQGDAEAGLTLLPKTYDDGFAGIVEEVRGDLLTQTGDAEAARKAYQAALDSESVADQNALQMKLNELAVAEASES